MGRLGSAEDEGRRRAAKSAGRPEERLRELLRGRLLHSAAAAGVEAFAASLASSEPSPTMLTLMTRPVPLPVVTVVERVLSLRMSHLFWPSQEELGIVTVPRKEESTQR